MAIVTLGVWLHGIFRKEVLHCVVTNIVRHFAKTQQISDRTILTAHVFGHDQWTIANLSEFCTSRPATTPMVVGSDAAHTPSFFNVFSSIPDATTSGGAHYKR